MSSYEFSPLPHVWVRPFLVGTRAMADPRTDRRWEDEGAAYARSMRLRFSPPRMVDVDGNIRQDYFRPQKVNRKKRRWTCEGRLGEAWTEWLMAMATARGTQQVVVIETKAWGAQERALLYEGIAKHGVGSWKDIRKDFLAKWDEQAIRIKTSKLMGCQNLKRYAGWKGSKEEIKKEHEKNRALGEKLGCWKSGYLVEDDHGSVATALDAEKKQNAPRMP